MSETLSVAKDNHVTWLKLNRPQALNSLNRELLESLLKACSEVAQDPDCYLVVVTGSGIKAFCAGADLAERKGMTEAQVIDYVSLIQKTMLAVENLPQPVIACMNGSAFGGGTELALACDLRVALSTVSMRLTEVKLGIIPGAGGTQRLPRLIGKSRAKELILTARALSAQEAYDIGLVHKLVEAKEAQDIESEFYKEVQRYALEIITAAPLALRMAKKAIDEGYDRDLNSALAVETRAYLQLLNTRDRLEGLNAFAEKRQPVYEGR